MKLLITTAAVSLLFVTSSHAATISILAGGGGTLTAGAQDSGLSGGEGFFRTGDGTQAGNQKTYDFTVLSGYDASTASKIVVTFSDELGGGDTFPASITFGGTALTEAAFAENGIQKSGIYYLDASTVGGGVFGTGSLTLTGTGSNDFGMSWLFLSGTADGVSAAGESATTASVSLTTVAANSFVIATHVNNNGDTVVDADLNLIFNGESGSAGGGSGYTTVATAGLQTYDFTGGSRPATTAVAFAPVPEPSSAALLGLAGLALALRRRR